MKRALLALALAAGPALAQGFQVGDRVHIGLNGKDGTVLLVGGLNGNGGTQLKVHVDGAAYPPTVGLVYDSMTAQVTVIGHGAAPVAAPGPMAPRMASGDSNPRPPGKAPVTAANCQQAIRADHPPTGADQSISVKFLSFEMSGMAPYEDVYKGDTMLGAHGHVLQAATIHAKYQVLTHFASPAADDQLRTYDAHFKCFQAVPSGELTAKMTDRLPGGETAQYIHKQ